jgi:nucleotide-binding universal stress UspA family protein
MKRFKNILLVFDPKTRTQRILDRAEALAKDNVARITILSFVKDIPSELSIAITAMPPQELFTVLMKERQTQVDALVSAMSQKGIKASAKVLSGTPFLEIIRQVLRKKHDLVMIAAEGKGVLAERLFGSTSMHLMRKCPCPVWVVKDTRHKKYQQILAAVDTTGDYPEHQQNSLNPLIMQLAGAMAKMNNAELHAIQVWSVYGEGYMDMRGGLNEKSIRNFRTIAKKQYTDQLNKLLAAVDLDGVTVHKHLPRAEDVSKAIVSLVKNKKIDLLVMGTVCRTGVAGFFIGNTAEKVLNRVNCSVLTVKPEGFVTPVKLVEA